MWYEFIYSTKFWLFGLLAIILGWNLVSGVIKNTPLRKLPRKTLVMVFFVGLVFTSGIFGTGFAMFSGTGSLVGSGGVHVVSLQLTNDFVVNDSVAMTGTNKHRLVDVRGAESWIDTGVSNDIFNGTLLVTRGRNARGELPATSLDISCQTPRDFEHESSPDGTKYHIVERDNNGVEAIYINTGASGIDAATTSSAQERGSLAFLEGVATGEVSFLISIEDAGYDVLDQYSYKDINCMIGDAPYSFRVHHMDA